MTTEPTPSEKALITIIGTAIGVAFVLPITFVVALYEAFCFRYLWAWFISEKFHLPLLTYADAVGMAIVMGLLTHQDSPRAKETESAGGQVARIIFRPAFCLLIGWCFKHFAS